LISQGPMNYISKKMAFGFPFCESCFLNQSQSVTLLLLPHSAAAMFSKLMIGVAIAGVALYAARAPNDVGGGAFSPSWLTIKLFTSDVTDYDNAVYAQPYEGKLKVLVIATERANLTMANGNKFFTGNHPVSVCVCVCVVWINLYVYVCVCVCVCLFYCRTYPLQVEMLLPMLHYKAAGFDFDIATPTGKPVALELWVRVCVCECVCVCVCAYVCVCVCVCVSMSF
jgi:hypothetical protein